MNHSFDMGDMTSREIGNLMKKEMLERAKEIAVRRSADHSNDKQMPKTEKERDL